MLRCKRLPKLSLSETLIASVKIFLVTPEALVTVTSPRVASPGKKVGLLNNGAGSNITSSGAAKATLAKPINIVMIAIGSINILNNFFIIFLWCFSLGRRFRFWRFSRRLISLWLRLWFDWSTLFNHDWCLFYCNWG